MTHAPTNGQLKQDFLNTPERLSASKFSGFTKTATLLLLLLSTLAGRAESVMYSCMAPVPESIGITLAGTLKDSQGTPITNGWVFIDAARPRVGPGFL